MNSTIRGGFRVQASSSHSADTERAELETVLDALARNPRLANLLKYLADRYFQGRTAEITECNIATEVFGRSKASFDGSTDSIARVEAHRLRKRLKEYYETEGRDHAVVISLPNRSYIPEFISRAASAHTLNASEPPAHPGEFEKQPFPQVAQQPAAREISEGSIAGSKRPWTRTVLFAVAAVAVVLLVTFAAVRSSKRNTAATSAGTASASSQNVAATPTPANAAHVPLRLLAG